MILQALYFFLPAYASNMAPVLFKKLNILPHPVDFNLKLNNKPLFGKNKSWGGLLYGMIFGTLIFYVQQFLYSKGYLLSLALLNYSEQPLLLGFLLASGAILGDLGKSFVKRRLGKKPGSSWFFFDQIDFVLGAFLFSSFLYLPLWQAVAIIFILTPILHYGFNWLGYHLGLKAVWW